MGTDRKIYGLPEINVRISIYIQNRLHRTKAQHA